eukprot:TRINITY_DN86736_c0_g1_i1.p1 TRINITY_DN86736_c0_g1~~TRINITY_DN86736_c0_g1_i1.p1  ORF type:complete len:467 (+),score=64.41 TRINITY_DN86736_c0_g1_i1:3-1403(+)
MRTVGRELPVGFDILTDTRQNFWVIGEGWEKHKATLHTFQPEEQTRGLIIKLLDIREIDCSGTYSGKLPAGTTVSWRGDKAKVLSWSNDNRTYKIQLVPEGEETAGKQHDVSCNDEVYPIVDAPTPKVKTTELLEQCWLVVHGLKSAKELNGKLGCVYGHQTDAERWEVCVLGVGTKRIKPSNLWVTAQRVPVYLVEWATNKATDPPKKVQPTVQWLSREAGSGPGVCNSTATESELEAFQHFIVPVQAAPNFKKTSPASVKLGVIVPPKPPKSKIKQANELQQELKAQRSCETCGATKKLSSCGGCKAVSYCSSECQRKNWKQHKKLCKQSAAQQKKTDNVDSTVVVPLVVQGDSPGFTSDLQSGQIYDMKKLPKNLYGNDKFMIKLQLPLGAPLGGAGMGMLIYDQARTFRVMLQAEGSTKHAFGVLAPIVSSHLNNKVYLYARREGANLVIEHKDLPAQAQPW